MIPFEELITRLESAVEEFLQYEDKATTYRGALIFERVEGVQNAIDDWRQGGRQ